jgi:hypothetical protein
MIASIVTTTTVSMVSIYTLAGSLALISILAMTAMLVTKDLSSTVAGERARRISRALNIAIFPLLVVFVLLVVSKVAEIIK